MKKTALIPRNLGEVEPEKSLTQVLNDFIETLPEMPPASPLALVLTPKLKKVYEAHFDTKKLPARCLR